MKEAEQTYRRELMVELLLTDRGITDDHVLTAFEVVPRHRFVDPEDQQSAYDDEALPLGDSGEAISDPYATAWLLESAVISRGQRVLEIGTGSGYFAALASFLGAEVHTIERHPALAQRAEKLLAALAPGVTVHQGDGWMGLPEHAPFDRIVVGCATENVSPAWLAQLSPDGLIVVPLGKDQQLSTVSASGERKSLGHSGFAPLARG